MQLTTVTEAAALLSLSKSTVSRQVAGFGLPKDRDGRFDLDAYRAMRAGINPLMARQRGGDLGYERTLEEHAPTPGRRWGSRAPLPPREPGSRSPAAAWAAAPSVLAALRAHGPSRMAARLASEEIAPMTIAVVCAHLAGLIDSLVVAACRYDGDPCSDGTMPPTNMTSLAGADYSTIAARLAASDAAADFIDAEMDIFLDQLAG